MRSCRGEPRTLGRRAGLDDHALVHEHDLVGDLAREAHLVRDHDHRHAVARQLAHRVEHVADELGVERRGRLVEQHQLRLHGERAGDRDTLLLAARERDGIRVELVAEPDPLEQLLPTAPGVAARHTLDLDRRQRHVLERGHMREQVELLEDHPDLGPLARHLVFAQLVQLAVRLAIAHELAVDRQPARVDLLEVVDAAQERGLARAGGAEHAHDLAPLDLEVDPLQHLEAPEALVNALGFDHRVAHRRPLPSASQRSAIDARCARLKPRP